METANKKTCKEPKNKFIKNLIVSLGLAIVPLSASALVIDIDTYVTGSITDPGSATVATLTITQSGSNAVIFRLDNSVNSLSGGIGNDAFISLLEFSYDGTPVLSTSDFGSFGGTQLVTSAAFGINPPGTDAGYDFFLDLEYPVSGSPSSDRFFDSEYSTWTVSTTDAGGISVSDFSVLVSGSGPSSLAMVHIQQVGAGEGGNASLKYVGDGNGGPPPERIPEPGILILLGAGLVGLSLTRRRKV